MLFIFLLMLQVRHPVMGQGRWWGRAGGGAGSAVGQGWLETKFSYFYLKRGEFRMDSSRKQMELWQPPKKKLCVLFVLLVLSVLMVLSALLVLSVLLVLLVQL